MCESLSGISSPNSLLNIHNLQWKSHLFAYWGLEVKAINGEPLLCFLNIFLSPMIVLSWLFSEVLLTHLNFKTSVSLFFACNKRNAMMQTLFRPTKKRKRDRYTDFLDSDRLKVLAVEIPLYPSLSAHMILLGH